MGGLFGGGSTSTVTQASPLQEIQAQYAAQIAPLLQQFITGGMSGFPTAQQTQGVNLGMNQLKTKAGQMGVAPGDPSMMDAFRKMTEGLTKPNPDVLNTAINLYTGAPNVGGSQTTTTNPGLMGTITGLGSAGMGIGSLIEALALL